MIYAFVLALVVALVFFCLWQSERDDRIKAELQVWMLKKKLKQLEKQKTKEAAQKQPKPSQKQPTPPQSQPTPPQGQPISPQNQPTPPHRQPKQPPKRNVGPVTVETAQSAREYVIRKPEPKPAKPLLDLQKLAELQKQTREAQSMLAEIFVQEEEKPMPPTPDAGRPVFIGILEKLFSKEVWTRSEIAEIAGPDVMIGNLLEQINEYACSKIDDIVLEEDGDRIYVTVEYKDRLI